MASDFGRAGPDETKAHCKSCEQKYSIPQTINSSWCCTYDELVQGAANGCPRCRFVAACTATIKEHLEKDEIRRVYVHPRVNEISLITKRGEFYLDFFVEDEETGNLHTPFEIQKVHRRLPEYTGSDTTKETMRGWLSECTKSHKRCRIQRKHGNEFRGPFRLLELKEYSIVLRENVEDVEYACLSHCWGKNPPDTMKTTEQTLQSFKEGITESNLPANFRDAIDVCRALDIKYLWIDSLCIIQDQKGNRDWNNQAAKMADIYENAHVTIAATRSAHAHGGCYSKRHPKHLAKPVPGYEGVFASVEPPGLPVKFKRADIPLNLPLLERGWVYQEMRLSRRVLHFCDEQVVWICQTSRRSESKCHDEDMDHSFKTKKNDPYEHMPYGTPSSNPKLLWYRYVHEYSMLQLTCPNKDRMAALAGLAKDMQNFHNMGRYLSGIWETSLIFDLGWFTEPRPNANSENISAKDLVTAPTYPSWSWASVKTPIQWQYDAARLRPLARLTQINCVADGPVHMGSLKPSSSITIQARAIKDSCLSQAPIQDTALKDVRIMIYMPDRRAQEHQAETGGFLLVVTMSAAFGRAHAIHVKLRSDGETYERVGFVLLGFYADDECHSDISLWDEREPWSAFPLMKVTLV